MVRRIQMLGVAVTIQCENCYDMGIVQEGMGMYSMDNCRGSRKAPRERDLKG